MTELDAVVAELREAALYHAVHMPSVHTPASSLPTVRGRVALNKKQKCRRVREASFGAGSGVSASFGAGGGRPTSQSLGPKRAPSKAPAAASQPLRSKAKKPKKPRYVTAPTSFRRWRTPTARPVAQAHHVAPKPHH